MPWEAWGILVAARSAGASDDPADIGAVWGVSPMLFRTRAERTSAARRRTTTLAGAAALAVLIAVPATAAASPSARSARMACPAASGGSAPRAQAVAIRCLVNRARARAGLRPMRAVRPLARAAGRHARDMGKRRFFSHRNMRGRTPAARARAAGWRGDAIGEAIAFGCGSSANALGIVRSWLASPPHRAILLSSEYAQMGVGVARRAPNRCQGGRTYVLEAGRR